MTIRNSILAVLLACGVAACGGGGDGAPAADSPQAGPKEVLEGRWTGTVTSSNSSTSGLDRFTVCGTILPPGGLRQTFAVTVNSDTAATATFYEGDSQHPVAIVNGNSFNYLFLIGIGAPTTEEWNFKVVEPNKAEATYVHTWSLNGMSCTSTWGFTMTR